MTAALKVGLLGFGRAGKAVASVLLQSQQTDLQWVLRKSRKLEHQSVPEFLGIDSDEPGSILSAEEFSAAELLDMFPVDVIVDFSSPEGIHYYGEEAARRKITVISAISEYPEKTHDYMRVLSKRTRIMHSPNITLGVNFLLIAAKILQQIAPNTDIQIIEEHFRTKPEVSGTALILAKGLGIPEEGIKSIRAGGIIGVHELIFGFPFQTVRLRHESISREAFGNGILFALQNMPDVAAGFFNMEDLLMPHFAESQPLPSTAASVDSLWRFWPSI